MISFGAHANLADISGVVWLEDISLADAGSVTLARCAVAAADSERPLPFVLEVVRALEPERRYNIAAELAALAGAERRPVTLGTTAITPVAATQGDALAVCIAVSIF